MRYLGRISKQRVMNLKYWIHTYFQSRNFYQRCCGAVFISTVFIYTTLLIKAWTQVLYIADEYKNLIMTEII